MDWESKEDIDNVVGFIRDIVRQAAETTTISEQQKKSLKTPRIKGPIWVSKFKLQPPPEDSIRTLLLEVIDKFNYHNIVYARPKSSSIDLEWIGFRKGVEAETPEPQISEVEKYQGLMNDNSNPGVVMFLYGGAF